MTDLVVGSFGEIGAAISKVLSIRGFDVTGYDTKNPHPLLNHYDMVHICIPYSGKFEDIVNDYRDMGAKVIVHSTVPPGTCGRLQVTYSPVRGVHKTMTEDILHYTKYYSGRRSPDMEDRFVRVKNVPDPTVLEATKIYVDTTYFGVLIAYRKRVDAMGDVDWSFAEEIHEKLGNRPIMYNDPLEGQTIGGHCVVPNLDLIEQSAITEFVRMTKD